MSLYVLERTEQGGGFVAKPGEKSYTRDLRDARTWTTREAAKRDSCPGNEVVVDVTSLLQRPTTRLSTYVRGRLEGGTR